jgi:hypothetical protein
MKGHVPPLGAALRALVRQKARKVEEQSRCICHRQKALTQMNVQLDAVVNDLMGKSGSTILRAIVAGHRNPRTLAQHRDRRLPVDAATVARSLHGPWRAEHLFALSQALTRYHFLAAQIAACDRGIEAELALASEVGVDLSRFPTSGHFCSWLTLAPRPASPVASARPALRRGCATAPAKRCVEWLPPRPSRRPPIRDGTVNGWGRCQRVSQSASSSAAQEVHHWVHELAYPLARRVADSH